MGRFSFLAGRWITRKGAAKSMVEYRQRSKDLVDQAQSRGGGIKQERKSHGETLSGGRLLGGVGILVWRL
jgi:hypothetical protein